MHLKAQEMDKCHPEHHCLTCYGVPYNCATCPKGYFLRRGGAYYTCTKCPSQCVECQHYTSCSVCRIKNHYGRVCQNVCSKGCLNSTCDQSSGTCLCKDNYEGAYCDYCAKGKYGFDSNCTKDCSANCYTCHSDKNCTGCKDGYYGNLCELPCSRGCYLGKCDQSNGTCYKSRCKSNFAGINCDKCSLGRFGNKCMSICPENCISCSARTTCDNCKDGYWGNACQHNCSHGCLDGVCLKESGMCQNKKCKSGFLGEKCEKCISGRYGVNCNLNETVFGNDSSASTIDFQICLIAVLVLFCFADVTGLYYVYYLF
ncbi:multiple epidermal growth factor-like domains protein 10 isoform X2 [Mercenaria mercenaria]|uniref:multiple epidermal growth factor-like domains protein 10 isoform X2 n=1 Tax=Mercenaria mercenaria TaxID=6596 RepID=UPI00234F6E97|nr:multiple epidermal growth factor-like domains protein 10 isoform X2 [Mercenaria mercenaria]